MQIKKSINYIYIYFILFLFSQLLFPLNYSIEFVNRWLFLLLNYSISKTISSGFLERLRSFLLRCLAWNLLDWLWYIVVDIYDFILQTFHKKIERDRFRSYARKMSLHKKWTSVEDPIHNPILTSRVVFDKESW